MIITFRAMFLAVLACCLIVLGFGLYVQHGLHIEPCPLCILQRIAFICVGLTALVAYLLNPGIVGRMFFGLLTALFSAVGAAVAARNIWLQHLPPDKVPECGPGLDYLLDAFPLAKVLPMVLKGSGECAKVAWTMFGLSIPAWALGWFLVFFMAGVAAMFLRERR
ncbi:disulfide bond formation protein B [Sulfurimicrobium lacus]|uniref:Disulfide bond formation protein B n=1 Tax=Sulfurimicrobium lacus TaxID=2715678 RepID=A0A6F8VDH7_9PROT|nr:disulfide bond formation protein B [Sulfurimicrobium lacus]BCB26815.1 disulfide bond formation protein B [Sulfurimicrobium lacus]